MENLNSVCYVSKINEIKPIEGADNIELAVVGGWNCITKKGEYNVDARVVIATTDAVIPKELSDKIGVTNYLRKGQRVRTVKLRGVYSECLIIPTEFCRDQYLKEGVNKMEELGITKYEPPVQMIQLSGGRKYKYKSNSNFSIYYKFPNLKNTPNLFNEEDIVQITRKIHGTNARFGIVKKQKFSLWDKVKKFLKLTDELFEYEFVYGSRNVEKGSDSQGFYSTDVWREICDEYNIKEKLYLYALNLKKQDILGSGVIIYGEIFGSGIQKNYDYNLDKIKFEGFDVVINNEYQSTIYTEFVFSDVLYIPHVKMLYFGKWSQSIQDKFVFNNYINNSKVPHEGIVIKHVSGQRHKVAKVINPEYLIYSEKHDVGDSH